MRINQNKTKKATFHISVIAMVVMMVYGYSMIHIKAVDMQAPEGDGAVSAEETKETAWQAMQNVALDMFGNKSPEIPRDVNLDINDIGWYDKKNLIKMKMQEQDQINAVDKNTTFPDIDGHKYEYDIETAALHGIVGGYENGKFYPDNHLKFGDLKSMIQSTLKAAYSKNINTTLLEDIINSDKKDTDTLTYRDFTSIMESLYSLKVPVKKLADLNVMINDDDKMTRAATAHLLVNLTDLTSNHIAHSEESSETSSSNVATLIEMGVIDEFTNGVADPNAEISREEFMARLDAAMQHKNNKDLETMKKPVTYEEAAKIIAEVIAENDEQMEISHNTTSNSDDDPWLVENLKPVVKKAVEIR